jgi:hypothetical protein
MYCDAMRNRRDLFGPGRFEWLDAGRDDVIAFRVGKGVNVTVMDGEPFNPPSSWGRIVLRSDGGPGSTVAADTGAWLDGH